MPPCPSGPWPAPLRYVVISGRLRLVHEAVHAVTGKSQVGGCMCVVGVALMRPCTQSPGSHRWVSVCGGGALVRHHHHHHHQKALMTDE